MIVVHIWDTHQNQTTEVYAKTIEQAIWAYAHHACMNWNSLEEAVSYNDGEWWVFHFTGETLTLRKWQNRNDRVWSAEWKLK